MLLLSKTIYPIETGLQSIFQEGANGTSTSSFWLEKLGIKESVENFEKEHDTTLWFLVFSIIWSYKTCAKTAIKIKAKTNGNLPLLLKLTLTLRQGLLKIWNGHS